MLDPTQAATEFQKADDALNAVILARGVDEAVRSKAIEAQSDLALRFTRQALNNIAMRTALFQSFIDAMEGVIATADASNPLPVLQQVQSVVDESKDLLQQATSA
jgi:hypothetical protein